MTRWFDPDAARSDPRLGGIGSRFLARILDVLVVGGIFTLVGFLIRPDVKADTSDVGLLALGAVIALLYEVPSTAMWGQTLGKHVARIRVVRIEDGAMPGANRSLLRYFTAYLAGFVPYIGLLVGVVVELWFLWDARRQNIPDKVARTLVVKVGQEAPGVVDLT